MSNVRFVGEYQMAEHGSMKPNPWNPNKLTPFLFKSLVHGMKTHGWITSQAVLVWGTDENKNPKNIIIDGEHRWRAAKELGIKECPTVYLDNLSERDAKALTIKLDQKRGQFDQDALDHLLATLDQATDLDLGFERPDVVPEEDEELEEEVTPITYSLTHAAAEKLRDLLQEVATKHNLESLSQAAMFSYNLVVKEGA